jgi:hypothetical protein
MRQQLAREPACRVRPARLPCTSHSCRYLAERGVDVLKVKERMGHASIAAAPRYFATTTGAIAGAMRKAIGWHRESG